MNNIDYIYSQMKDIRNKTPILLVGDAGFIFKRLYKGNIHRVENTEDIKELIDNFYGIEYNKPIVIDDISLLYRDSLLLKFVEETTIPLILIASEDNISIPLLSRMKTFIKLPYKESKCNFVSILEAQKHLNEEELSQKDMDLYLTENCPELMRLNKKLEKRKNKDKIIQILGGLLKGGNKNE